MGGTLATHCGTSTRNDKLRLSALFLPFHPFPLSLSPSPHSPVAAGRSYLIRDVTGPGWYQIEGTSDASAAKRLHLYPGFCVHCGVLVRPRRHIPLPQFAMGANFPAADDGACTGRHVADRGQ